jgi:hypothetical protein
MCMASMVSSPAVDSLTFICCVTEEWSRASATHGFGLKFCTHDDLCAGGIIASWLKLNARRFRGGLGCLCKCDKEEKDAKEDVDGPSE